MNTLTTNKLSIATSNETRQSRVDYDLPSLNFMNTFASAVNLHEEIMVKPDNDGREIKLVSNTKTFFRKLSDNLGKVMVPFGKIPTEKNEDTRDIARSIARKSLRISKSDEEFKKLKEHLRSSGLVTNAGLMHIMPGVIDAYSSENPPVNVHNKNNTFARKSRPSIHRPSILLEKQRCGISWSVISNVTSTQTLRSSNTIKNSSFANTAMTANTSMNSSFSSAA